MAQLQWAAITVGVSPITASTGSRPRAELAWRSALMESSLEPYGNRWKRSRSYDRLDASEKSAVSYFLGMAQTQLSVQHVLGIPTLAHVDTYYGAIGGLSKKSRPDFIGFEPVAGAALAVEAKGRTNNYAQDLVDRAKSQAEKLPALTGTTSTAVASVAWFDSAKVWNALLVDPPRKDASGEISPHAVLAAHYLPIVRAAEDGGVTESSPDRVAFSAPAVDLEVSLPYAVFELLARGDNVWAPDDLADAGAQIAQALWANPEDLERTAAAQRADRGESSYMAGDFVEVTLGESWSGIS